MGLTSGRPWHFVADWDYRRVWLPRQSLSVASDERSSLAGAGAYRRLLLGIRFLETELLNSISNLIPVKAQQCGRARLIAMRALERLDDESSSLRPRDTTPSGGRSKPDAGVASLTRDVCRLSKSCGSSIVPSASSTARSTRLRSSRTLPGQLYALQRRLRRLAESPDRPLELARERLDEMLRQQRRCPQPVRAAAELRPEARSDGRRDLPELPRL